jgi:hypothetical protein
VCKKEVIGRLAAMMFKYQDLVWYAQKDPRNLRDDHPDMPKMVRIIMSYKYDSWLVVCDDDGWHKGFNAGCLAALRLALELLTIRGSGDKELRKFPDYKVNLD